MPKKRSSVGLGSGSSKAPAKKPKKERSPECWTVSVTGLREGDVIRGISQSSGADYHPNAFASVKDVVLRVHKGSQAAYTPILETCEEIHGDELYATVASRLQSSAAVVKLRLESIERSDEAKELIGLTGTQTNFSDLPLELVVVDVGAWDSEKFREWASSGTPLSGSQIIQELKEIRLADHTRNVGELALRHYLWELAPPPTKVFDLSVKPCADASIFGDDENLEMYKVEGLPGDEFEILKVPSSETSPLSDEAVLGCLKTLFPGDENVDVCWEVFSKLTAGKLKSAFQKFIRCGSDFITIGDRLVRTSIVAASAVCLCCTRRGNQFIPELGQFVRGQTSAFKRMAVVMVEDAWPEDCDDADELLEGALAIALCSARVSDYFITASTLSRLASLCCRCVASRSAVAYSGELSVRTELVKAECTKRAARLIRIVRSLKGDLQMFDVVSEMKENLRVVSSEGRHQTMPIHHLADQHVFRGVGHALRPPSWYSAEDDFCSRFEHIFARVTGFNPRRSGKLVDESDVMVVAVRRAQMCVTASLKGFGVSSSDGDRDCERSKIVGKAKASVKLDPGTLSGGVGPVNVKVNGKVHQVILGIDGPESIVFPNITRDKKTHEIKPVDQETKDLADEEVASMRVFRFRSPMLESYTKAVCDAGSWVLEGAGVPSIEWTYDNSLEVEYDVISPREWMSNMTEAMTDDELVLGILRSSAVRENGSASLVQGAQGLVKSLCAALGRGDSLRMLSLMRNQYSKIAMPVPSLEGGKLGADQLMVMKGDWNVWRALVLLCALAPGVISPGSQPPNFVVLNAPMLRMVERWIDEGVSSLKQARVPGMTSQVSWAVEYTHLGDLQKKPGKQLKKHQEDTIKEMFSRDKDSITKTPGHYINMETGTGKTITALRYAIEWCTWNSGAADRIVWCVPKESLKDHCKEIVETWQVDCEIVDESLSFDAKVNLVDSDNQLRKIKDDILAISQRTFFVFDEVHTLYNPTYKTSVARMCARLCAKFVCMTATPLTGKSLVAIDWLADTCGFPVTKQNELVAAARMFSAIVRLPIKRIETLVEVPLALEILSLHKTVAARRGCWLTVAAAVRRATSHRMCEVAIERAIADRAKYPLVGGGVLLAANSIDEAKQCVEYINANLLEGVDFRCGLFDEVANKEVGVVVVTMDQVAGYNSAVRLGVLVTGVYGSSAAKRHQLRGRLYRFSQVRDSIEYVTVVMAGTILKSLHDRHSCADGKNAKIQEVGRLYEAKAME